MREEIAQARQTRTAQEEASRTAHRELVFRSLSDPVLQACWEPPTRPMTAAEWRQIAFTNLIVARWDNSFRLGRMTEDRLRGMLDGHFRGERARAHWEQAGDGWVRHAHAGNNRRARRFADIAAEQFRAAVAAGPAVAADAYFTPDVPSP
ncbi:DUF6082 family protein [Streptomyces sp. H39-S7]|uniref:DUF6082 family protein n=1 Tax=Streptomyces sp. H39-S7 TaxID=3004357 RepID=UPI0022AE593F|nr:DUF6082 family protein [Streptomyces sp. H39-S7]MCZ4124762.1 DUF6082 family protein [Streptomyces sp. H39-S7]